MIRRVHNRDAEGGFTLIELLVVIVILGVLAAVVVVSVSFITDRGTNAACKTDVQTVNTALQEYYAQNNAYPAMQGGTGNTITGTSPFEALYTDGYLSTDPTPAGQSAWTEGRNSWTHNGYTLTYALTTNNGVQNVTITPNISGCV